MNQRQIFKAFVLEPASRETGRQSVFRPDRTRRRRRASRRAPAGPLRQLRRHWKLALIPLAAGLLVALLIAPPAVGSWPSSSLSGPRFEVEALLRNGRKISGWMPLEGVFLRGRTAAGELVETLLEKPPSWSSSSMGCEIEWMPDRGVYRVRTWAWTGELKQLVLSWAVVGESGTEVLRGETVSTLHLRYAKP